MPRALTFLAGAATGAAVTYFLDPQGGAGRRAQTKEKAGPVARSAKEKAVPVARSAKEKAVPVARSAVSSATEQATNLAGKARSAAPGGSPSYDDVTLARKVESEIFRSHDAPKGSVSVNAENGVVFLRGALDDPSWIERLGSAAEQVDGVEAVRNLLHQTGTPAPAAPGTF
jgi:osmotically-inducible protein OsmY